MRKFWKFPLPWCRPAGTFGRLARAHDASAASVGFRLRLPHPQPAPATRPMGRDVTHEIDARHETLHEAMSHAPRRASYPYETAGKMVEILVFSSQGGAGTLEKGHRGAIFPGKFPETENLKGGHISSRISGNVRPGQIPFQSQQPCRAFV